jgi:hypothetical protein
MSRKLHNVMRRTAFIIQIFLRPMKLLKKIDKKYNYQMLRLSGSYTYITLQTVYLLIVLMYISSRTSTF